MNLFRRGSTLHNKSIWAFGKARWLIAAVLALLGTLGTLLTVPEMGQQMRTDIPGLRCWLPVPMDGAKFTVVMAPFTSVNEQGRVRTTRDGRELARLLYARLENSFEGLNLDIPYELRAPDQSCPILGESREARARAAEDWATTINADVVIYGAILTTDASSELQPEFYVAYRGFTEAAELVGPHELGRPVRVAMPVQADALEGMSDHPLNARAQALSLIALGLASYAVDDYDQALDYFIAADEVPNWPASAGKEMLYVLMGTSASRLASTTLDSIYVDEALDYFDQALEIDPTFARALVGQGSAIYQLALGNLQTRQGSQVDVDLLDEAEAIFQDALTRDAPAAAEIEIKAHFGLGQVYLVRHYLQLPGDDWLARARAEFDAVIASFVAVGALNHDLVGHAYARQGLIAHTIDQDPAAAVQPYVEAIALVTPRWQAQYGLDLGDVYAALDDTDNARTAYADARAVAELYGDQTLVDRAEERLAALP